MFEKTGNVEKNEKNQKIKSYILLKARADKIFNDIF